MSTDQLQELFAELRSETLPQVRPPGTEAVRRTTRQRRRAKVVGSAVAVLMAVAGGGLLAVQGRQARPPVLPAATSAGPATPDGRAKVALDRLIADDAGAPGRDVTSPVVASFEYTERYYVTPVVVTVACVGTGATTLVVSGGEEIVRIPVRCGDEPDPERREVALARKALIFTLDGTDSAASSGLAFRVTSPRPDIRTDWDPGTYQADDVGLAVGMVGDAKVRASGKWSPLEPSTRFRQDGWYARAKYPQRPATLAMICRGDPGTFTIQFRRWVREPSGGERTPTGTLLVEQTVQCGPAPARQDFVVEEPLTRDIVMWTRYRAPAGSTAEAAYTLAFR